MLIVVKSTSYDMLRPWDPPFASLHPRLSVELVALGEASMGDLHGLWEFLGSYLEDHPTDHNWLVTGVSSPTYK